MQQVAADLVAGRVLELGELAQQGECLGMSMVLEPLLDGPHQGHIGETRPGARIPNGREAGQQHVPAKFRPVQCPVRRSFHHGGGGPMITAEEVQRHVGVHVHEAGQQGAIAEIDDRQVSGNSIGVHRIDQPVPLHDDGRTDHRSGGDVDHALGFDNRIGTGQERQHEAGGKPG